MVSLIVNSDFGGNQIGGRLLPIAKLLKNPTIYCRSSKVTGFNTIQVVPFGKPIMQALTALPIYVSKSLNTNPLKVKLFETFLIKKYKPENIVHSWDPLPKFFKSVKEKNPKTLIIQDIPMALPTIIPKLKNYQELWKGENIAVSKQFIESIPHTDVFIAPSEFVKESLLEYIPTSKIRVIPFGVDSKKFKPKKTKRFRIAFLGNINNRKGIPYLIQAFKELTIDAELHLYGRVYPEVKQIVRGKNIILHGVVDAKKELPKNTIYVFPSLMEGSSKSVYEAMACGLPVITTHNAGSVVTDKSGFIIPVQDVEAIKEKIRFFCENPKKTIKYGEYARKIAQKYSWERYAKSILNVYKNAHTR